MAEDIAFRTDMAVTCGEPLEMCRGVARIVAGNPGPLTFKGTNTYLVGERALAVIDPGPDDPAHVAAVLRAAGGRPVTHIFVTHRHRDHVDGAARLKAATGARTCALLRPPSSRGLAQANPAGKDFINFAFRPDIVLADGATVEGPDWRLEAICTPGHAPDHLCLALEGEGAVFTGDHVMGWNTSVIAPPEGHMAQYLASLEKLLPRSDSVFLPGHGGPVAEPQRMVKAYLLHRRAREQAVLGAVRDGARTVRDIVPAVYQDLPAHSAMPAALSVLAHIEHLIERGFVTCNGALTFAAELSPA